MRKAVMVGFSADETFARVLRERAAGHPNFSDFIRRELVAGLAFEAARQDVDRA